LGNAVAVVGFFGSQHYYKSKAEKAFVRSASQYTGAAQRAIDSYLEVIDTVETLFTISDDVDRWEFYKFVEENLQSRPGIKALGWVPLVSAEERDDYETRAQQDGLFGFQVTERDAQGNLVAAESRPEYLPLYYLDPYEGNEDMLGHDLYSNPGVMESLSHARDQGEMVADVELLLGTNVSPTDLTVMLPVYKTDETPDSVALRQQNFAGAAIGIIGLEGMITAAMEELDAPVYSDIYFYERKNGAERRLLYHYVSPLQPAGVPSLTQGQVFQGYYNLTQHKVAGEQWDIVVKPGPGQISNKNNSTPWNFATMSMLLTAMMIQYMFSVRNRTRALSEANEILASEVAERKAAEEAAQAAKDQAIMANGAKSEFLAMVSHELRTPLNAIIGFSEILSQQMFGPIGKEQYLGYAQDILSSGTHLLSLINDILDLSKIEADKFELNEEETRIDAAVEAALRIVRERAEDAGLTLSVDTPPSLPALHADDRALKQILINLLSNAIKFTPSGGRVHIEAGQDQDGGLVITVSDTGIGIAEEDMESVLQPFIQVDTALSRKYEGTGLGLTLTRSLVELHDGALHPHPKLGGTP
jgi:signal transduction histidine kinase